MKFAIFVALIALCSIGNPSSQQSNEIGARLDQIIPKLMKEGEVPGLSIVVIQNAQIVFERSYGMKNFQTHEPLKEDMIFEAASLSKPVFAYSVLRLVENGSLDLDAQLSKYLPKPYIENDERLNLITARRVLSHTTGFPNWRPDGGPLKIHFVPGTRFSYSGEGFVYLQKVVEKLTNKSADQFIAETVFAPLGMTSSSYVWQKKFEGKKVNGHNPAGEAQPLRKPQEANAAGSLNTTIGDYARFVIGILRGTGLKQSTINEMLRPQIKIDERCHTCIDVALPYKYSNSIFWGLGWGLQKIGNDFEFWHWGDNNGEFHSYVSASLLKKSGIVIFTNSGNGHSIIPEITSIATRETHPAFKWMDYEAYNSPLKTFFHEILSAGNEVIQNYKDGKSGYGKFSESEMNRLGYWLIGKKKMIEAISIFKINAETFPQSWNAHDSLAEAYMLNGDKLLAIQSYKKSLQLNPQNSNATSMLKKLE